MEKNQQSSSSNDKSADKKAPQPSGNVVWYMLGLGVLLLLMVTIASRASRSCTARRRR